MGSSTFFGNASGSGSGSNDFVKDAFEDVTLPADSNTGLTSTASTNPMNGYFANFDAAKYQTRTLYIQDLVQVTDRSQWINSKPTYKVVWNDTSGALGYVFGNVQADSLQTTSPLTFKTIGDGFGVTGTFRRVQFIVVPNSAASATAQLVVDGSNTTTIDFSNAANDAPAYYIHAAANETAGLHDFRLTALQASTLRVIGVVLYYENAGANIEMGPGTTYSDKTRLGSSTGGTMAIAAYGSSMGGRSVAYKITSSSYGQTTSPAATVISNAQGFSGTNLVAVTTGTGASFQAGGGIVVPQGTSMYVGVIQSISTDTLTVSPTLAFGLSNTIYQAWLGSTNLTFGASLYTLSKTVDFAHFSGATKPILDPFGKYNVTSSNVGVTTIDGVNAAYFLGASGFLQIDGYFSAAEIEMIGNGIFNATVSINGLPSWSLNTGQTGAIKRTLFAGAGPGWNSVVIAPGSSMGTIGFPALNLYERARNIGVSFGAIGEYDTLQAYTERTATNATLMALGLYRRMYADMLPLSGSWVRGATFTAAGGAIYYGASTNSVLRFEYFGKNFGIIGTPGSSGVLTIDGVSTAVTFNAMTSVSTEGFHTVTYTNKAGTAMIQALDFARTTSEIKPTIKLLETKQNPAKKNQDIYDMLPVGWMQPWAGKKAPKKFAFCDGKTTLSRQRHPDLFEWLQDNWGVGAGQNEFTLPDLRGRNLVGRDDMGGTSANVMATFPDNSASGKTIGATGGERTHQLTITEMPVHTHSYAHDADVGFANGGSGPAVSASNVTNNLNVSNTGGDGVHNNVQPGAIVNWVIKISP